MAVGAGIVTAIRDVTARAKRLAKLQVELARAEMQEKGRTFAVAIGMFVAAAMLAFFVLALLVALIVALLDLALPLWLAILITLILLAAVAVALAMIGSNSIKSSGGAAPTRAIAQMQRTQSTIKDAIRRKPVVVTAPPPDMGSVISPPKQEEPPDAT